MTVLALTVVAVALLRPCAVIVPLFGPPEREATLAFFASRFNFDNKADFEFAVAVRDALRRAGSCAIDGGTGSSRSSGARHRVLVGGVNEGQLAHVYADACPGLELHGFELQKEAFDVAVASFRGNNNVRLRNAGMSDETYVATANVMGNGGEEGFLLDTSGTDITSFSRTIALVSLAHYAREIGHLLFALSIVDVEGHEPVVIHVCEAAVPCFGCHTMFSNTTREWASSTS